MKFDNTRIDWGKAMEFVERIEQSVTNVLEDRLPSIGVKWVKTYVHTSNYPPRIVVVIGDCRASHEGLTDLQKKELSDRLADFSELIGKVAEEHGLIAMGGGILGRGEFFNDNREFLYEPGLYTLKPKYDEFKKSESRKSEGVEAK